MKSKILTIGSLFLCLQCFGQNGLGEVLRQIEENNPQLVAARAEHEVQMLENKSEAKLDNPEIEYGHLYGAEDLGIKRNISFSQSFDVATISGMKSRQVSRQNELSSFRYRTERIDILLQAKQNCIDLVHKNILLEELNKHLADAQTLVKSYSKRLEAGESTILDLNKAKVHLTAVQSGISRVKVEIKGLQSDLRTLNGGEEIAFAMTEYDVSDILPEDFDSWYEETSMKNPALQYFKQEVAVSQGKLAIDKTAWMPKLALGFMGEYRSVEKFSGITFGVNIPLWSNADKVRQAKAQTVAAKAREDASALEVRNQYIKLYEEARSLKALSEEMRRSLNETDNRSYLLTAQSKGEISIVDYLVEMDMYYEVLEQTLACERDYRQALAALNAVNL